MNAPLPAIEFEARVLAPRGKLPKVSAAFAFSRCAQPQLPHDGAPMRRYFFRGSR